MASCTQIEGLVQGCIDGELSEAEHIIVKQHLLDCASCAASLNRQHRLSALLFEYFAEHRMKGSLRDRVIERLPEMAHTPVDMAGINWRAKHPVGFWSQVARFAPAGVVAVLLLLGLVLFREWPGPLPGERVVGVVTQSVGNVVCTVSDSTERQPAFVKGFVECGQRFETSAGALLAMSLAGPTQIVMNSDARLKVYDARRVSVEQGEVWLDVGKDGRLFKVTTPAGDVTVFGTKLSVAVNNTETVVTLEQGELQVENDYGFVPVEQGQQVSVVLGREPSAPRSANVAHTTAWARKVVPDREAAQLFADAIESRNPTRVLIGRQAWLVDRCEELQSVNSIRLEWQPAHYPGAYRSYDVYVYDAGQGAKKPLFKDRLDRSVFKVGGRTTYEIVPTRPITGVRVISVVVVPDEDSGEAEVQFRNEVHVFGPSRS